MRTMSKYQICHTAALSRNDSECLPYLPDDTSDYRSRPMISTQAYRLVLVVLVLASVVFGMQVAHAKNHAGKFFFTTDDQTPVNLYWAVGKAVTVPITQQPSVGTIKVSSSQKITYTPKSGFSGKVTFIWKGRYSDGTAFTGTVEVTVNCVTCGGGGSSGGKNVTVSWGASSGQVDGYRVYFGTSSGKVTTLLSDLNVGSEVNANSPSKTYNNLGLQAGDYACFRVRAYNSGGTSSYSPVKCRQV